MTITGGEDHEHEYRHSFRGEKEYFGKITRGSLPAGNYTATLTPYGKKGASARFVFSLTR